MTTLIIRFSYLCLIMTFVLIDLSIIYPAYARVLLLICVIFSYASGYFHRETNIILWKKWYNGKDLQ